MNLVADIGGTNTRLALSDSCGPVPGSIRAYGNDEVGGFDSALDAFRTEVGTQPVDALCLAVAGPVAGTRARLTNRDWHFQSTELAGKTGAHRVVLMNDLAALGYALPHLRPDQVRHLRPAADSARAANGQRFVLGLGTGVNLSVNREVSPGVFTVLEAEAGHMALPATVFQALETQIGTRARAFDTLESLFAGKGFSALHTALTLAPPRPAHEIVCLPEARKTADLLAHLLGLALRELILAYMPLGGVYLAGGAARGLIGRAHEPMLDALALPHALGGIIATPNVQLITDDAAALSGCAARLAQDDT